MNKRLTFFFLLLLISIYPQTSSANEQPIESTNEPDRLINAPTIESNAGILMDSYTGTVLFEKNADALYYPASLTKIATAIFVLEHANLEDVVTVSKNARRADGTRVYLEEGEQMSLLQLTQGLLINSGNDAGIAIAEHISGSEEQFGKELTTFLKETIHTTSTNFTNATGLFDEHHQTTARDLALITQYAMNNDLFMEMFGTVYLPWVGQSWNTTIITHHRMLKGEYEYEGTTGGKTGYVPESGFTLATTAERNQLHLIAIVLDGTNKSIYRDTRKLFNYGFDHYEPYRIAANSHFSYLELDYTNEEEIIYVKEKDSSVHSKVSPTGLLHLLNENGQLLKSVKLTNITPLPKTQIISLNTIELPLSHKEVPTNSVLILIGATILGILLIRKLN